MVYEIGVIIGVVIGVGVGGVDVILILVDEFLIGFEDFEIGVGVFFLVGVFFFFKLFVLGSFIEWFWFLVVGFVLVLVKLVFF